MGTRLLYGIMQGYRKSQQNYENIQTARAKKKRDDEEWDFKKKKFKLDLEAKTRAGEMEQVIADQIMEQFNVEDKVVKAGSEKKEVMLKQASYKAKGMKDVAGDVLSRAFDAVRKGEISPIGATEEPSRAGNQMATSIMKHRANQLPPSLQTQVKGTYKGGKYGTKKTEPEFRDWLQAADKGEISYERVRQEFPDKAKQISQARVGSLNPETRAELEMIDSQEKAMAEDEYGITTARTAKENLKELLQDEKKAKQAGIDVDKLLKIKGLTRDEVLGGIEEPKDLENIKKPEHIKTQRQAVEWLVNDKGLTQDQAISFIKAQTR